MLDDLVEIQAEPEPKDRTVVVLKLTTKCCEDINSNKQQARTRQGIMRMLACYEKILETKRPFSA
jgi:hypothetical protein